MRERDLFFSWTQFDNTLSVQQVKQYLCTSLWITGFLTRKYEIWHEWELYLIWFETALQEWSSLYNHLFQRFIVTLFKNYIYYYKIVTFQNILLKLWNVLYLSIKLCFITNAIFYLKTNGFDWNKIKLSPFNFWFGWRQQKNSYKIFLLTGFPCQANLLFT